MIDKADYTAKDIQVLEGLEAVRKRPAMYIGDIDKNGLHHLVFEVLDNSVDEALVGYCKNILLELHSDGSASVTDDGRGIPTDRHESGKSALEVVLTILHAGGKFGKSAYAVSGGLHGVGVSVVNALSETLSVEVHRGGKIYAQSYENGTPKSDVAEIGGTEKTGTKVRFKPSTKIFKVTEFDFDYLRERIMELAFLNAGLKITIKDERTGRQEEFHYEGGIEEFVEHLNKARTKLHMPFYYTKTVDNVIVEYSVQYTDSYSESIYSFVNGIKTKEGGTHVSGFKTALTRVINEYMRLNKVLKDGKKISGDDALEGLTAVISIKVPEPQFEGQTKTKLGNSEIKGIVDSIAYDSMLTFLEENPPDAKKISQKIISSMEAREAAQKAKDLIRRKNVFESSILPGKLSDCIEKDPAKCELFIVEGDSAGGCFSGDTKVSLVDDRDIAFKELVKEHADGKKNYCYTLDNQGKIATAEIRNPRRTKRSTEVIKVILDNRAEIICTPDHLFRTVDGGYTKAIELSTEIYLAPLYKTHSCSKSGRNVMHIASLKEQSHKVVRIEKLKEKMDVYDLEVEGTHNFALSAGVFVHNSSRQGRDRHFQAILPLRGKILNVEKAPMHKVLASEEIKSLVLSIGAGFGDDFDPSKARYHKFVIMVDADVDGSHIRTLILTLFYRHFKSLIEKGYIYIAQPPLYKIKKGKDIQYAYSDAQLQQILKETGEKAEIQRYKGLGEMNPEQLWETTMDPKTRTFYQVTIEDAMVADELFTVLMGDEVGPRKEFIEQYAREVKNLDI